MTLRKLKSEKNMRNAREVTHMPETKCSKCGKTIAYDLNMPYRCPYCRELL